MRRTAILIPWVIMGIALLRLHAAQAPSPSEARPPQLRTPQVNFEFAVPTGWTLEGSAPSYARLLNADGASLVLSEITGRKDLEAIARDGVDRTSYPLGFAKTSEPRHMRGADGESIEYEIRGNRLSERHRILYRVIAHDGSIFEIIYENSEERFEANRGEADRIASSIQLAAPVNERLAITDMQSIAAAETKFLAASNRFAILEELMATGYLDARFRQTVDGYRFRIQADRDGYRIDAAPSASRSGRYAYQSDQTGIVRYSDRPELAPQGMAGKPVR